MENAIFKCKGCGNELNAANAESGVVVCEYCGMARTVPKRETKPAALSYLMLAEHDLDVCAFDNAFTGYKKAAEADGDEPEAYFGMALARFNVQYLKDLTGQKIRLQPICHEVSGKKFCEDVNYRKALEKATSVQRAEYERKGKEIDYIRGEFEKLEAEGLDYDCFLCVKVTDDETKLRTKDYKRADDIYFNLRKKGYKPFFSERELDNVTGADYEARILYALYSSECMIVVCGNENYLQTPWVKNEYTRFLKLIGDEEKESDSIALAWFSSPIEKLAGKRGKIQGINLDALDASERITAFVENHTPEAKKRREEERARKAREAEEARRKLEEQERAQRELLERQKLMEERLKSVSAPRPAQGVSADVNALLFRAKQEAEFGDFSSAEEYYKKAIEIAPQVGEGWWGAFLCTYRTTDEKTVSEKLTLADISNIKKDKNYIFATRNAAGELKERISSFAKGIEEREIFLKEEEKRIAEEKAEAERKQREEEARIAREKAEEEKRQKDEEERSAYERENDPTISNYNPVDFEINGNVLVKYIGKNKIVKIPRGVARLGSSAFPNRVSTVIIPDSVISIGKATFASCGMLEKVVMSHSMKDIAKNAFFHCYNLLEIELPDGVTRIGNQAFDGCSSLKSIKIPDSVTSMGMSAFAGCSSLSEVKISDKVTVLEVGIFSGCSFLRSVQIPNGVTAIEREAFSYCTALSSVTFSDSIKSIGDYAFSGCSSLVNFTIPNSVTWIGSAAFSGCSSLSSVILSDNVISIGESAFSGCSSFTNLSIPNGVEKICSFAFLGCKSLQSVTIPNRVTSIGEGAFKGCSSLTDIVIPNSVLAIDNWAFENCTALTSVTMPKRFKKDRKRIFAGCKKIKFTFTK